MVAVAAVAYATLLRPEPPSRKPVLVKALSVADRDGRRLAVSITVVNEHTEAKTARVWWLLAVPGRGPEWDRRAYRSSVRSLHLRPGEEMTVAWDEEAQVPPGLYSTSAWVHVEGANGFTHEDGHVGEDVEVGPAVAGEAGDGPMLRAGPPRFGVEVADVAAPAALPARSAEVSAVVRNPSDQIQRTLLRWGVFPIVENVPSDWWRQPAVWWGEPKAVDLDPGQTAEVTLGDLGVTEPGRYGVRLILDTTAREAGGPLDDVALPTPLEVEGPTP